MSTKYLYFAVIYVAAVTFLSVFGSAVFGINDVEGYQKGNRIHQLSIIKFELFMFPFSAFTYFRLLQFANSFLVTYVDRTKKLCETKYLRLLSFGMLSWLFLAHVAYFLYLIPDSVPYILNNLCLLSLGLWYHIVIPLTGFGLFTSFVSGFNAISIYHPPMYKYYSKLPILKTFCLSENAQIAFILAVAVFLYSISLIFRDELTLKHLLIKVENLPNDAEGIRFALISDTHAGGAVYKEQIARVVDRVNSELVDAVFFVGDAVDAPKDSIIDRVEPLRFIKSKTFYVSGNHDFYYGNALEWFQLFQQYGFEVLNNRHMNFHGICIAGVSDYSSGTSGLPNLKFNAVEALRGCPPNRTTIVLSHNPASAKEIVHNNARLRVDLILSGHTHAGQFYTVAPIAYLILPYFYGLYQITPKTQLFVTAGTLYQGAPMKMVGMSEIWIITLRSASKFT